MTWRRRDTQGLIATQLLPLALSAVAAGCVLPPEIHDPDESVEFTPRVFFLDTDNPTLAGLVSLEHLLEHEACPGGSCGEKFLNVQYHALPMDPVKPENTAVTVSGSFEHALVADQGVFNHGMVRSPEPLFSTSRGSVETFLPTAHFDASPWIWLPQHEQCTRLDTPPCSLYKGRTFPFLAGNVSLPPGVPVTLQFRTLRTDILEPGHFLHSDQFVDQVEYLLSAGVPVVPVHLHVFADEDGENAFQDFRLDGSETFTDSAANFGLNLFDFRQLDNESRESDSSGSTFTVSNRMQLQVGRNHPPKGRMDRAFGRCKIATRLVSFNIIRQREELEERIGMFQQDREDCATFFQTDSQGNHQHPVGRYIQEIIGGAAGLHVFVTGCPVGPDGRCSTFVGFGCEGGDRPFVIVQDVHRSGLFGSTLMFHEMGHALELGENSAERFSGTFLAGQPYPDPANLDDAASCATMRTAAERLQDAYYFDPEP